MHSTAHPQRAAFPALRAWVRWLVDEASCQAILISPHAHGLGSSSHVPFSPTLSSLLSLGRYSGQVANFHLPLPVTPPSGQLYPNTRPGPPLPSRLAPLALSLALAPAPSPSPPPTLRRPDARRSDAQTPFSSSAHGPHQRRDKRPRIRRPSPPLPFPSQQPLWLPYLHPVLSPAPW
ncbi:hypothetical protein CC80DRAFT_8305 [Byssothecium circinans]|uniref:Uncharacterized protein n=1 Tax=Byssothecium circinans TaxID=147558 RepID=A0A6A5UFK3_9PLEO|nr:hypothetical protein CC80DRAFT_8305 [Byssothecium circinans]